MSDPLEVSDRIATSPMVVNLGPSHPAMHGVVRLVVELDGETIVKADPEIGFLHRGFEKSSENSTWIQVLPYTDRLNYVSPLLNNVGYMMAVEKLIGIQDPPRSQFIRVMAGEISRICDHLTCLGAMGLELGAMTVFLYGIEARDLLWDRITELCGARLTTSYTRVGGVANDLPAGWMGRLLETLERVVILRDEMDKLLTRSRIFYDRTRGIGKISAEEAVDWGWTGPCLRACGVNYDVRKAYPYLVYGQLDFDVPLGTEGDTYDRYLVRIEEMKQSDRILRQCVKLIPGGEGPRPRSEWLIDDWRWALPDKEAVYTTIEGAMAHFKMIMEGIQVPAGETYAFTEGANGELGFFIVSRGQGKPWRIHVRGPGFPILGALPRLIVGGMVPDLVPTFDSINMIAGEVEQ